jgi:hypothetical protein
VKKIRTFVDSGCEKHVMNSLKGNGVAPTIQMHLVTATNDLTNTNGQLVGTANLGLSNMAHGLEPCWTASEARNSNAWLKI